MEFKWKEVLKKHSPESSGEDLADSIALIVLCALIMFIVFTS